MQGGCNNRLRCVHQLGDFGVVQAFDIAQGKHLGSAGTKLGKFLAKPILYFHRGMRAFRRETWIGLKLIRRFHGDDFAMAPRPYEIQGGVDR